MTKCQYSYIRSCWFLPVPDSLSKSLLGCSWGFTLSLAEWGRTYKSPPPPKRAGTLYQWVLSPKKPCLCRTFLMRNVPDHYQWHCWSCFHFQSLSQESQHFVKEELIFPWQFLVISPVISSYPSEYDLRMGQDCFYGNIVVL